MNWTGGRLQRHSTAAGSAKNRQKQYFAKVQQSLRNEVKKSSPIKWSTFGVSIEDSGRRPRYSTIREHHDPIPYHGRSHSLLPYQLDISAQQHHERNILHSVDLVDNQGYRAKQIKQGQIQDDDIYNTTPLPSSTRKRAASEPISDRASTAEEIEKADSIVEKRRKILEKRDWVGVGIQKPLQLAFAMPEHEDSIGKRQRMTTNHHARFRDPQTRIASPFCSRKQLRAYNTSQEPEPARLHKSDVRISIGNRVVLPDVSLSSVPKRYIRSTNNRKRSQTTSSDVMLLDNDRIQVPDASSAINVPREYASEQSSFGCNEAFYHQQAVNEQIELRYRDSPFPEYCTEEEYVKTSLGTGIKTKAGYASPDKYINSRKISQGPTDSKQNFHQSRLIFSSSSASIQHPKPRSSRLSVLVCSDSPGIADSTVAQIGQANPLVPSSQILDNDIWKAWIALDSDEINFRDINYRQGKVYRAPSVSISPGVSIVDQTQSRVALADEDSGDEEEPQTPGYEEMAEGFDFTESLLKKTLEAPIENVQLNRGSKISLRQATKFQNSIQSIHAKAPQSYKLPGKTRVKEAIINYTSKKDDTDDVWRSFVFGSSGYEKIDIDENEACADIGLDVTDASDVAQPNTPRASDSGLNFKKAAAYYPIAFNIPQSVERLTAYGSSSWSLEEVDPIVHKIENLDSFPESMAAEATSNSGSLLSELEKSVRT